jgi:hypothetical protein
MSRLVKVAETKEVAPGTGKVVEAFGEVASLKQKDLVALRRGQLNLEGFDFPARDQGWQKGQRLETRPGDAEVRIHVCDCPVRPVFQDVSR